MTYPTSFLNYTTFTYALVYAINSGTDPYLIVFLPMFFGCLGWLIAWASNYLQQLWIEEMFAYVWIGIIALSILAFPPDIAVKSTLAIGALWIGFKIGDMSISTDPFWIMLGVSAYILLHNGITLATLGWGWMLLLIVIGLFIVGINGIIRANWNLLVVGVWAMLITYAFYTDRVLILAIAGIFGTLTATIVKTLLDHDTS